MRRGRAARLGYKVGLLVRLAVVVAFIAFMVYVAAGDWLARAALSRTKTNAFNPRLEKGPKGKREAAANATPARAVVGMQKRP